MWQFLLGSNEAFVALECRARRSCVKFRDQAMPPNASPPRATVAFEINDSTGTARLLVAPGVAYTGTNDEVRTWLSSGVREFDDFAQLRSWLLAVLKPTYTAPTMTQPAAVVPDADIEATSDALGATDDVDLKGFRIALRRIRRRDDSPS